MVQFRTGRIKTPNRTSNHSEAQYLFDHLQFSESKVKQANLFFVVFFTHLVKAGKAVKYNKPFVSHRLNM